MSVAFMMTGCDFYKLNVVFFEKFLKFLFVILFLSPNCASYSLSEQLDSL